MASAAHLYVEFDGAGVDPVRLRDAATKLVARHPMLRVEILPDGTQRISDRGLPVTVFDLREAADADGTTRTSSGTTSRISCWTTRFCEICAVAAARRAHRVCTCDMDMQAADAVSYRNFMADLAAFYRGAELPELGYTYREYRAQLTAVDTAALPGGPRSGGPIGCSIFRNRLRCRWFRAMSSRTRCAASGCGTSSMSLPGMRCSPRRTGAASPGDGRRGRLLQCAGAVVDELTLPAQPADVRPRALPSRCRQAGGLLHLVADARHRPGQRQLTRPRGHVRCRRPCTPPPSIPRCPACPCCAI